MEIYPLTITEAVLGNEKLEVRTGILRLWIVILTFEIKANPYIKTSPEADHITNLIGWLASIVGALEEQQ